MILLIINALLVFAWGAVTGSFSVPNLFFGFVLSLVALSLIREQVGTVGYFARTRRVASLVLLFLYELMMSAIRVAIIVTRRDMNIKPGIIAYPLKVDRDFEITLLANMITLTPGTLSVDVSHDRKVLFVHALDCSDPEGTKEDIANGFERKILEAFR